MKTAIIISDTHGNISAMEKVLPIMQESDYVFHLGDHQRDIELFERDIKGKIISVKGNCDGGGEEIFTEIEGVKIIAVHGDRYGVKSTPMKIYLRAKELGANDTLFADKRETIHRIDQGFDFITFQRSAVERGIIEGSFLQETGF